MIRACFGLLCLVWLGARSRGTAGLGGLPTRHARVLVLSAGFLCFQPEGTVRFPSLVFLRFHCLFRWYVFCLVLRNICCPFVLHDMVALHLFRVSRQFSFHLQFPTWCFLPRWTMGNAGVPRLTLQAWAMAGSASLWGLPSLLAVRMNRRCHLLVLLALLNLRSQMMPFAAL